MKELDLNFSEMRVGLMAKLWEAMRPILKELDRIDDLEELLRTHTGVLAKTAPQPKNGNKPPKPRRQKHPSHSQLVERDQALIEQVSSHPGITTPELVELFKQQGLFTPDLDMATARRTLLKMAAHFTDQIRMERSRHPHPYSFFPTDGKFHPRAPSKPSVPMLPHTRSDSLAKDILTHLTAGDMSAIELTDALAKDGITRKGGHRQLSNSVSYHLRTLVAAGVVKRRKNGNGQRPLFSANRPRVSVQKTD